VSTDAEEAGRVADLAAEVERLLEPAPERDRWPSVSAVIPTHDGRDLLETLLTGLAKQTDYPDLEVVVVDNASGDGTVQWLEAAAFPFPLIVVRNARNLSFSAAMNAGASRAGGDLLLLLNNDVEPIEPGWLKRLVVSLERPGVAVAGAVLVDPNRESVSGRQVAVQHDGIAFRLDHGVLRPMLRGLGDDVSTVIGEDGEVAAVAAACALMRTREFDALGGFDERFRYGGEDIDLCLRLAERGGRIAMSRTSVLLHRPLSTRRGSAEGARESILANHTLLLERWGPALRRNYALDRAEGGRLWNGDGGRADAGVTYCLKPGSASSESDVRGVIEQIEAHGHPARQADGTDAWLLDDVVIHLRGGAGRHAVTPGRLNVLLCRRELPPAREAAQYDIVLGPEASIADVLAAVDAGRKRRAGPRVVVVLGMARTGTSVTTRILNLLGMAVGEPEALLGAIERINEKGFYEHYAMMRLNTALLRRFGGTWRDPPVLPAGWESDPEIDDLREQAAAIIANEFAGEPLWGFKDPRTCLTLPFWRPLIGPAAFVICHRHPLEIAASLERRDELTAEQSVALWRRYTAGALAATAEDPRMIIGYRNLLEDPMSACEDLATFVGASARAAEPSLRREVESWVDGDMRHHRRSMLELVQDPNLGPLDVSLVLLLELAARTRGDGARELDGALNATAVRMLKELATPTVAADG
jgi:GT2 family glycosyltransferase